MSRGLFFFKFIYLFIFACHFLKPLKFVWGLPKWKREKEHFAPGENEEK